MVQAGIMVDGHTDLHTFNTGNLKIKRYRDEILYIRLFCREYGPNVILMDDNTCPQLVDEYHQLECLQCSLILILSNMYGTFLNTELQLEDHQ
ncbi:hypothetical protein TNCV_3918441 [Trichonephila clavipes]|nr:hypothetical protein TNCV_3918441 [Trichonephila clavipes]